MLNANQNIQKLKMLVQAEEQARQDQQEFTLQESY